MIAPRFDFGFGGFGGRGGRTGARAASVGEGARGGAAARDGHRVGNGHVGRIGSVDDGDRRHAGLGGRIGGLPRAQPQHADPDRDQRERPEGARPAEPEPEAPGYDREPERHQPEPEELADVDPAWWSCVRRERAGRERAGGGPDGQHHPGDEVRDHADAAEECREHEAQPHEQRVDVEMVCDPARDAAEHPVVGTAVQAARRAPRLGGRGARGRRPGPGSGCRRLVGGDGGASMHRIILWVTELVHRGSP